MRVRMGLATVAGAVLIGLTAGFAPAKAEQPSGATGMREPPMPGIHDGGYVGLTVGLNANELSSPGLTTRLGDTSYFGGAYIGWGMVAAGTYYGVELDGMLRDVKPHINDGTSSLTMSNRWLASARGRLGMPIGPALLYATGGIAVQDAVLKLADPSITAKDSQWVYGLVGGGGIEAKLTHTMAIRFEVLHYAWKDQTFTLDGIDAKIGQADTVARIGIGFKLN